MAEHHGSVVVTGAAKGIGRACALRLARRGFRVYAGVRNLAAGEELRAEAGANLFPVQIDVTQSSTIAAAVAGIEADADAPRLAGLVNNAGIAVAGPLEFMPLDELRRQLEVNVIGQVAMAQALLPLLRKARGRIINIGSISGKSALPLVGPYAASKHALEAITDSLRVELRSSGVDVVIIEPGVIATPIWETSIATAEAIVRRQPKAIEYYGTMLENARKRALGGDRRGLPADRVARVVERALTARQPKTRYMIGGDARLRALFQHLPDRWRDRIIAGQLARI